MLARFSTVLQNAADALAPPAPPHEDFAYHWKKLMKHYLDVSTSKQVAIELTNIPAHFDQLLKILLKEDEDTGDEAGPCLEYLLQHNLLDLLVTLANSDDPPGMRQYVLQFITRLLTHLKTPITAHTNVYPSLQRLVGMCDGSTPTPTESDEVNFLFGLTALLRRNPQLIPLFTAHQGESSKYDLRRNSCSSDASSQFSAVTSVSEPMSMTLSSTPPVNNALFAGLQQGPSTSLTGQRRPRLFPPPPLQHEEGYDSGREEGSGGANCTDRNGGGSVDSASSDDGFPILDSLLSYLNTADSKIRLKVCQSVMLLVSVPEDKLASVMTSDCSLCARLAQRLADLCRDIPETTEPNHIDDMNVRWGLDAPTWPGMSCEGCRQVASFLSWFDFCNQIMLESHVTISDMLGCAVRERFLDGAMGGESLTKVLTMTIIAKCFKITTSSKLNSVLCEWVIGSPEGDELCEIPDENSILGKLLSNWRSANSELALETLRFIELIVAGDQSEVYNSMCTVSVSWERSLMVQLSSTFASCLLLVLLEKGNQQLMHYLLYIYLNDRGYVCKEGVQKESDANIVCSVSHIDQIIQSFLDVIPVELRSSCDLNNAGYEQYVSESQRQYSAVMAASQPPQPSVTLPEREKFFEGPFLRALFDSIANIPNQEYEINLELTAVVSRLALCSHPRVDEYLLNTTLVLGDELLSLHRSLQKVACDLVQAVTSRKDFRQQLSQTRARLLGADLTADNQNEWSSTYECIVVVEELCKELAAIAYVKHRHGCLAQQHAQSGST